MSETDLDIEIDSKDNYSEEEFTLREEKEENVDSFSVFCDEILKRIEKKEIIESNFNNVFNELELIASKSEITSTETRVKYLLLKNFFLTWEKHGQLDQKQKELDSKSEELDKKARISNIQNRRSRILLENLQNDSLEHDIKADKLNKKATSLNKKARELDENLKNINSEILTMMGLFFAIFTFVQVNFTFTQQFLEKYNGYRLLLYITIINAILLIVLGFILEAIGTIVYGENKAREGIVVEDIQNGNSEKSWLKKFCTEKYWKSQKYLLFFPESKLKMKRALIYSLLGLFIVGTFSFYKEKKNYSRSYEEIDQIIMKKVEDKISSINKTLSEDEKKQIKLEIESSIYRDLYNQKKEAPQVK